MTQTEEAVEGSSEAPRSLGGSQGTITLIKPGALAAGANALRFTVPFPLDIVGVTLGVSVAPATTDILVDINKAGTTIFTTQGNRPKIIAAGTSSVAVVAKPDAAVQAVAVGDLMSVDLDTVGTTTTGSDLVIVIHYERR